MKKYPIEILLLLLTFFLPGLFISSPAPLSLTLYIIQYFFVAVPQIFLIIYIIWIQKMPSLTDFGIIRIKPYDFLYGFLLALMLFLFLITINILVNYLPSSIRKYFTSGYRWQPSYDVPVLLLLVFSFITGYREELFFRCYLLTRFSQLNISRAFSFSLSAILFSLGHLYQGLSGFFFALVWGFVFAFTFTKKRNIHILAIAHGFYNFTALLINRFFTPL